MAEALKSTEDKDDIELRRIRRLSALIIGPLAAIIGGWFLYDWWTTPQCTDFSCASKLMLASLSLPQVVSEAIKFFRPSETDMPLSAWAHGATSAGIAMAAMQSNNGFLFAMAAVWSGLSLFYSVLWQKRADRAT